MIKKEKENDEKDVERERERGRESSFVVSMDRKQETGGPFFSRHPGSVFLTNLQPLTTRSFGYTRKNYATRGRRRRRQPGIDRSNPSQTI